MSWTAKSFSVVLVLYGASSLTTASELPTQIERGKAVFDQWCWECHGKSNPHGSGTWSLRKRDGDAKSPYLEERNDFSHEYVEYVVRRGQRFMPRFRYTEISDMELAALTAYLSGTPHQQSE